ncbi:MAG: Na(+)/H(+) antiporter subunit B [Pseudomonadota bacterium]|nr:Na(+)/H(+) antiporter subunit B [Pseudomonadota bacterium]|tara:strand:+ start:143 stop:562 length:420 start_codon:yes stop_codon:yes gene_type:complete
MKDLIILRIVTKLIIPLILLFGLYVQFHGDYSPGGGFQAGVILASGFILYNIIFGINVGEELLSQRLSKNLMGLGVLLFVGVGIAGMALGDNFLEYNSLGLNSKYGQIMGIFLVEVGVGLTVANVMILVFYAFNKGKVG